MRYVLFCFLCFWMNLAPAWGQRNSRAEQLLLKAQNYKAKKDTAKAFKTALEAIDAQPNATNAYSTLGLWYIDARYFLKAARLYSRAMQQCSNGAQAFGLPAARSYLFAQKPDSALLLIQGVNSTNAEAKKIKEQAKMMIELNRQAAKDTTTVRKLSTRINSIYPEFFPSLSSDRQTLYFTRRINGVNEDFFFATPDSCGDWFTARNLGYPPNTAAQESAQTISADDHYLFFMRSDNRSENGWGRGGCDLYLAYRKASDSAWSAAESFGATINTPAFEGMPSLSTDINDLYFVSDRPGGYGGLDIWVSHFQFGLWQLPINLGPQINTPGNETAPFIGSDNKTIYFASDGHPGLGGSDLFVSKKTNDSLWSMPVNLGIPFNSAADDHSIFVTSNGRDVLFASDRGNTGGNLDIYESTLPERFSTEATAFALCYVLDSLSKEPAPLGSITIFDSLGNELAQYHANKGDGSLMMSLPIGKTFQYSVRAFGYTANEGSIQFPVACPKWCNLNFTLLPRNYVKPTKDSVVLIVHFEKNVVHLSDSQKNQIAMAVQGWEQKEDLALFANGYTDNTGTPLINTEKSTIRANAVAQILTHLGIEESRISVNGFGDTNPLVPNDSPENQTINRRVEIVMRWSY